MSLKRLAAQRNQTISGMIEQLVMLEAEQFEKTLNDEELELYLTGKLPVTRGE
jgi:hypothetical protein